MKVCRFVVGMCAAASVYGAQVSGTVRGEDGQPIPEAYVSVIFHPTELARPGSAGSAFHSTVQSMADGSYTIGGIPAGTYRVCAQAPQTDWLNTCQWASQPLTITLTANQTLTNPIVMPRGHRLTIRIEDPEKHLTKEEGTANSAVLQVGVVQPNGLYTAAAFVRQDEKGREEEVLIPFDTDVTVSVSSSVFSLADAKGKTLGKGGGGDKTRISRGQTGTVYKFQVVGVNDGK